mmetsp:Transcript_8227/g.12636  ORF Transcript_8227/g.12636 Transcript_8227/m.12636 type:complete len:239 (-) Transcript_8227:1616-2332(-)
MTKLPIYTYSIGRSLYAPITCRCNSRTLPQTRGPNFTLPPEIISALCRFRDLEEESNNWSPWCAWLDTQDLNQRLPEVSNRNKECQYNPFIEETLRTEIEMRLLRKDDWKELKLGGEGEPTLNLKTLQGLTREFSNVLPITIMTNGLIDCVDELTEWGVSGVSVSFHTHDPEQYNEIMEPLVENAHEKLCNFVEGAVASELKVELTGIDRPGIDKEKAENLAVSLGVNNPIRWRVFFE